MVDRISQKHRSWTMSRVRSKNSKPEVLLRSLLHRAGFRFSINDKKLPGKPDIVLPKYKTAIFVHGCFWHRHEDCPRTTTPKSNREYWLKKFQRNVSRDREVRAKLKKLGVRVIVVWECEILKDPLGALNSVVKRLEPEREESERKYNINLNRSELLKVAEKRSKYLIEKDAKKQKPNNL